MFTHCYWKQGALGAAGVRDGLQLSRSVRAAATSVQQAGVYCVATRTACYFYYYYSFMSNFTILHNYCITTSQILV